MWNQLQGYLNSVAEQLPTIQDRLKDQINQHLAPLMSGLGVGGEEVAFGPRRFRMLSKIGEGGYSFVYLAEEADVPEGRVPRRYALKKVLAGEESQLDDAKREVATMKRLRHPNLLPLVDSQTVAVSRKEAIGARHIVYMLFPLFEGDVWDYVQGRLKAVSPLDAAEVVHIFSQLCAALEAMHAVTPALAHRDVKPQNILIAKRAPEEVAALRSSGDTAHLLATDTPAVHAALMDFGSASPAVVHITSRAEALDLQEHAERCTTAPYRPPELWDVPSSCTVDARVDVWAAGCVLYYLMVGASPFERTANEAGGSLMLAIVNGQYKWPEFAVQRYPAELRALADACLKVDPAARPTAKELRSMIEGLPAGVVAG